MTNAEWPAEWEQHYPIGRPFKPSDCPECRGWRFTFLRWPVGMTREWWACSDLEGDSKPQVVAERVANIREKVEPCWACAAWRTKKSYTERKQAGDKKGGKS